MALAPSRTADDTAQVMPRSLNDPVGLAPSTLSHTSVWARSDRRGASISGVEPSPSESAVERLMTDRRYFTRPARTLFRDVRAYFPIGSQLRVLRVIEHFVGLVDQYIRSLPQNGLDVNGNPLQCPASTRKGTPCQRM